MSVISTQLEIIDNMSVPLINIASNIENVIDLLAVADSCIDVWGGNTPDWLSSVGYVSDVVGEISNNIERNTSLQLGFNNAVVVGVKEMDRLVDRVGGITDTEMNVSINVSENIDINGDVGNFQIDVSEMIENIDINGIIVNVDVNAKIENIDFVIDRLEKLRDIQNDIINSNINIGLSHNVLDDVIVSFDIAYEMTFGNLIGQIELIKDSVGYAVDTVDYGVGVMHSVLMGVGSMLVESVANPFCSVFEYVSDVVSDCMVAPVETVRSVFGGMVQDIIAQFVNMSSVVENIINKIPMVNVDISTGVNNIYNNVIDTYSSKNNSKVAERVVSSEAVEVGVYRNDINTVKDSIEFGKSVAVNEVDRKYMLDSVSVNSSKFAVADVNVTVNNNNNISSEVDANAVVAKLSDGIKQAMNVAVSGVYA